jgi:hypothetical protein
MSDFKTKENTGFLFKNKFQKEDKHPQYRGIVNVTGKEMNCALWYNKEKDNFYLAFSEIKTN